MEARTSKVRWTWAEFARLPEERGVRHEVIADELHVTPAPRPLHQRVVKKFGADRRVRPSEPAG